MSRLGRQLRHEAKTHPKKAAVLGLLALVAVWFWGPLVWGWLGTKKSDVAAAGSPPPQATAPYAARNAENAALPPWNQLVAWREADLNTTPRAEAPGRPNPFHPAETVAAKAEEARREKEQQAQAGPPPDPASLGLAVTSTIVGPTRRVALINGKPYRKGDDVVLAADNPSATFRLAEIDPGGIVLTREDERFDVRLSKPDSSGRIEIIVGEGR
ncbi:MAG: hypothetical protein JW809_14185 [Pirellulales bacterium]|nr:hypothetical protein [Pirellulales bacterium]